MKPKASPNGFDPDKAELPDDTISKLMWQKLGTVLPDGTHLSTRRMWCEKLKREGKPNNLDDIAKVNYRRLKQEWIAGGKKWSQPSYVNEIRRLMAEGGYTNSEELRRWWKQEYQRELNLYRASLREQVAVKAEEYKQKLTSALEREHYAGKWKRDDMPPDLAWVASRPCLLYERQSTRDENGNLFPLTDLDYEGCPSPLARLILNYAYQQPEAFVKLMLDITLRQYGKITPPAPSTNKVKVVEAAPVVVEPPTPEEPPPPEPVRPVPDTDAMARVMKQLEAACR